MKSKKLKLIVTACLLFVVACKKQAVPICCGLNPPDVSIFHNWNILSDSSYVGAGLSNHPVVHLGVPGDYFDVTTKGIIYTNEGGVLDTLTYQLLTDSTIVIPAFGVTLNGVPPISKYSFTASTMRIASPTYLTPGGIFGRTINLYR